MPPFTSTRGQSVNRSWGGLERRIHGPALTTVRGVADAVRHGRREPAEVPQRARGVRRSPGRSAREESPWCPRGATAMSNRARDPGIKDQMQAIVAAHGERLQDLRQGPRSEASWALRSGRPPGRTPCVRSAACRTLTGRTRSAFATCAGRPRRSLFAPSAVGCQRLASTAGRRRTNPPPDRCGLSDTLGPRLHPLLR
jgi:hypothetical protein